MSLRAALALVRPWNLLALAAATLAGARLSGADPFTPLILVPGAVAAFGYARNDAVDAEADRRNRPARPVASGAASRGGALAISWGCLGAGVALLAASRPPAVHVGLLAAGSAALYFYSPWGKGWGIAGPGIVAALAGLAVAWGGFLGPAPGRAGAAALLASAATFARECFKDLEDLDGDRAAGKRTWAVHAGPAAVERAARAASAASLLALPAPWLLGVADRRYLLAAGLLAAPVFLGTALRRGAYDRQASRRASLWIKVALLAGIAGLLWGAARFGETAALR